MLKKCATSVLHFNKKNLILGHIPYLYLRKNIFYCRIETHKVTPRITLLQSKCNNVILHLVLPVSPVK